MILLAAGRCSKNRNASYKRRRRLPREEVLQAVCPMWGRGNCLPCVDLCAVCARVCQRSFVDTHPSPSPSPPPSHSHPHSRNSENGSNEDSSNPSATASDAESLPHEVDVSLFAPLRACTPQNEHALSLTCARALWCCRLQQKPHKKREINLSWKCKRSF